MQLYGWQSIINDHIVRVIVFEEAEDVKTALSGIVGVTLRDTDASEMAILSLSDQRCSLKDPAILKDLTIADPSEVCQLAANQIIQFFL